MRLCILCDEFLTTDNPEKAVSQNEADVGTCTVQWFYCSARTMTQWCDNMIHFVELKIHWCYDLRGLCGLCLNRCGVSFNLCSPARVATGKVTLSQSCGADISTTHQTQQQVVHKSISNERGGKGMITLQSGKKEVKFEEIEKIPWWKFDMQENKLQGKHVIHPQYSDMSAKRSDLLR